MKKFKNLFVMVFVTIVLVLSVSACKTQDLDGI